MNKYLNFQNFIQLYVIFCYSLSNLINIVFLIIFAAYTMIEPLCNNYYNIIREEITCINQIPRHQCTLAYDQGRRWGPLTTNLAEAINSILKQTRNLPISSLVLATYTRCNTLFTEKRKHITVMIIVGHVYSKNVTKVLQDGD